MAIQTERNRSKTRQLMNIVIGARDKAKVSKMERRKVGHGIALLNRPGSKDEKVGVRLGTDLENDEA